MVRWVLGSILHGGLIQREGARCSSVVYSWCDEFLDRSFVVDPLSYFSFQVVSCSSVVRAFAHGAMGRWIDPSRWTHELYLREQDLALW